MTMKNEKRARPTKIIIAIYPQRHNLKFRDTKLIIDTDKMPDPMHH